jgi:hypothetical protein
MDQREMARQLAGGVNPWLLPRQNRTFESYVCKHAPATARRLLDEAGLDPADYGLTIRAALGLESPEVEARRRLQKMLDRRWKPNTVSQGFLRDPRVVR